MHNRFLLHCSLWVVSQPKAVFVLSDLTSIGNNKNKDYAREIKILCCGKSSLLCHLVKFCVIPLEV